MTSELGTNSEITNPKTDSAALSLDTLSFTLKEEHTGIKVDACVKLPPKEQDPVTENCILTEIPPCILVFVSFFVGILIPLWLSTFFDSISMVRFLAWLTSTIGIIALLFWIYCWYRVRMSNLTADERKLGYGVLKELAGKLPEYSITHHVHVEPKPRNVSTGQPN